MLQTGVFHIVALVYALVSNQPIMDAPLKIAHTMQFKSIEACQTYLKGDEFGIQREALASYVRATFEQKLEADAAAKNEDAPAVGIAITASCEEDNTI